MCVSYLNATPYFASYGIVMQFQDILKCVWITESYRWLGLLNSMIVRRDAVE